VDIALESLPGAFFSLSVLFLFSLPLFRTQLPNICILIALPSVAAAQKKRRSHGRYVSRRYSDCAFDWQITVLHAKATAPGPRVPSVAHHHIIGGLSAVFNNILLQSAFFARFDGPGDRGLGEF